jgi:hypothetical protein
MATSHFRTAVLLAAGITLTASPSFAQRDGRRNNGEHGRREGAERAQPRGSGESRAHIQSESRGDRGRVVPQVRGDSRARIESQTRGESRGRAEFERRVEPRRRNETFERVQPRRQFDNRSYGNRSFDNRAYGYRPYGQRSYVVPYGYRPYGYRPGWNLNLYFGRPYSVGGYPDGYGYFAIAPGLSYGALRIVDAPRDAQVFVDGYYAGVVDDYDGVFQHLNLEAGSHHIEIEAGGYPPFAFDVSIVPGRTITYHARIF